MTQQRDRSRQHCSNQPGPEQAALVACRSMREQAHGQPRALNSNPDKTCQDFRHSLPAARTNKTTPRYAAAGMPVSTWNIKQKSRRPRSTREDPSPSPSLSLSLCLSLSLSVSLSLSLSSRALSNALSPSPSPLSRSVTGSVCLSLSLSISLFISLSRPHLLSGLQTTPLCCLLTCSARRGGV